MKSVPPEKRKEQLLGSLTMDQIKLQPFYYELKNEIIEPDKVVVATQYFWDKWAPLLGPTLTVLVVRLRRYCYYNKLTKEKRDWCYPKQETLAKEIGVSADTVQRELKREVATYFITRKPRYIYSKKMGKKIRTSDMYYIAMDDPLIPKDEKRLVVLTAEKIVETEGTHSKEIRPKPQFAGKVPNTSSPKPQNAVQVKGYPQTKPQIAAQYSHRKMRTEDLHLKGTVDNVKRYLQNQVSNEKAAIGNALAKDIVSLLGDHNSRNFYKHITRICPTELIYRVLGETKEAIETNTIRTTKGAYFTDLLKRRAKEQGIDLGLKTKPDSK